MLSIHYRYELNDAKNSATSEHVLEVWCYEAYRLFRDRLVGPDARNRFDNIMATIVRSEWSANVFDNLTCKFYGLLRHSFNGTGTRTWGLLEKAYCILSWRFHTAVGLGLGPSKTSDLPSHFCTFSCTLHVYCNLNVSCS